MVPIYGMEWCGAVRTELYSFELTIDTRNTNEGSVSVYVWYGVCVRLCLCIGYNEIRTYFAIYISTESSSSISSAAAAEPE